jgi:hypothetical protein
VQGNLFNIDPTKKSFSNSQVHCAEYHLGLKQKAASRTADLAFLPVNLQKRGLYWTQPLHLECEVSPSKILSTSTKLDSFLGHSNRNFGKTFLCQCCSQNGVYRRGEKVNLLLAICGDNVGRMHWHEQWMDGGTTIERFFGFIDAIMNDFELNHPGRLFVITMDNLNTHKNFLVTNWKLMGGHRYVFHAPYWPVDGAVEYVFNAIPYKLRIIFNPLETMDDLRNRMNLMVSGIQSFYQYFEHVGFPVPPWNSATLSNLSIDM